MESPRLSAEAQRHYLSVDTDSETTSCGCWSWISEGWSSLIESIMSLFSCIFGSKEEQGVNAVAVANLPPIEDLEAERNGMTSAKSLTSSSHDATYGVQATALRREEPTRLVNRITVVNHSKSPFNYVEVFTTTPDQTRSILKADLEGKKVAYDAYEGAEVDQTARFFSGTSMREPYQLQIACSKTADCSVSVFATAPFLVTAAYRSEMARRVETYYRQIVQETPSYMEPPKQVLQDLAVLHDELRRIGPYTLPESLPAPLLKELKELESEMEANATEEAVTKKQLQQRAELLDRPDVFQGLTRKISTSGRTTINLYDDRIVVEFNGAKPFKDVIRF